MCKKCGKAGHFARDCLSEPLPDYKPPRKDWGTCKFCGLPGHWDKNGQCPERAALKPETVKPCTKCGSTLHVPRRCPTVFSRPKKDEVCPICNQPGHGVSECTKSGRVISKRKVEAQQAKRRANAAKALAKLLKAKEPAEKKEQPKKAAEPEKIVEAQEQAKKAAEPAELKTDAKTQVQSKPQKGSSKKKEVAKKTVAGAKKQK